MILKLALVKISSLRIVMSGWDIEVYALSRLWNWIRTRFWNWNLIKICVRTCDMNSILGSVVPLAMFKWESYGQLVDQDNISTNYRDGQLFCKLLVPSTFFCRFLFRTNLASFCSKKNFCNNLFLPGGRSGSGLSGWSRFTWSKRANYLEQLRCRSCGGRI